MNRKELNKTFMITSNSTNTLVPMVYREAFQHFIYLFISICHDNGVVQHKLQKMFASTIYIQTMLSLKKPCYDWQTITGL